jgi:hypothetical protein
MDPLQEKLHQKVPQQKGIVIIVDKATQAGAEDGAYKAIEEAGSDAEFGDDGVGGVEGEQASEHCDEVEEVDFLGRD